MKKTKSGPSLYHVSDKAISDGLEKIPTIQMVHFLRRKGVFVSSEAKKADLIRYIITFNFGYSDFLWLTGLLETPNNRVRNEVSRLDIDIDTEKLKSIANSLKDELKTEDVDCKVIKKDDVIKLELNYISEDLTVSELRQKRPVKSEIEITNNKGFIGFSYGSLGPIKDIKASLIKKIQNETDNNDVEPVEISLQYITKPEARSEFFTDLTENIEGYRFDDILSVDVTKNFLSKSGNDDQKESAKEGYIAAIRNAALKGVSVTNTPSFEQLHEDDYYIYRIVWSSIEDITDGKKVIFEVQFGDREKCKDFKYLVKYIHDVAKTSNAKGAHTQRHREITPVERKNLNSLLESAALQQYRVIVTKYGG
ncbi:hypothetical protein BCT41_24660 [Vibrio splendidus]|uniref:hypothetical protein n=1 Tax=Vibrio TaxID=662 RepID=UPI000C849520|nr:MULTISPECIES: hypothetical protein [Vibrio]PMK90733.1 hypothetical protein BCT89_03020 [Vibrio lentus]PMN14455.1 hypothetical protein BCT41_24660 [Vibrio splendidus]TKF03657.1 hypothetical protein FCV46_12385 [Vibrio kanaloae]TKF64541.1 hypothetical protein FCV51_03290 [Vibrio kanaloae]